MLSIRCLPAAVLCLAAMAPAADDHLAGLTKAVTSFKLSNGAQFFVVDRPYSPTIAFHLRVKAGTADEPTGRAGLAAMALLSFLQGSEVYGTRNAAAEKAALADAEKALQSWVAEEAKGDATDDIKKGRAEYQSRSAFDQAAAQAMQPRYFDSVLGANGATNFEMRPMADFSDISVALPSNRAEIWFRMVGSWLQAPSTRFFVKSREMVSEQRERAGKNGIAQRERSFGAAFSAHPYASLAGGDNELTYVTPAELTTFMKTYYLPPQLTIAMVGDIRPAEARRLAEQYFGKLAAGDPPMTRPAEMQKLDTTRQMKIAVPESPVFSAGWPRPGPTDAADPVFEILQGLFAGGPQSLLYQELLIDSKAATRVVVHARFPGGRYPGLFTIEAELVPARSFEDVEAGLAKVFASIAKNGVGIADLEQARLFWRARLLNEARTGAGRAQQLVRLHTEFGTHKVEEHLARLEAVTAEDCRRVVNDFLAAHPYVAILQTAAVTGAEQQ